jgi:hypothetical protein
MHALRRRVLLGAVDALIAGRRLTLMDVARSWLGAERVRAPLKALDRLLGNRHLQIERERVYADMAGWLMRDARPLILVDWSDLKPDKSWHLLRAAVAVGGRALPILDAVFPGGMQGSPKAERQFLHRLKAILPAGVRPILITDAGFRTPWFRAVAAMGWLWLGRLRQRTQVKPVDVADHPDQWLPCKALYNLAIAVARDLGLMHIAATQSWPCRVIVHGKRPKGRKHRNRDGQPARSKHSRQNARREREPWLLVASPDLHDLSAHQLVAMYTRRMQIELSFRDLKSHRFGQGFEDSLTRKGPRIEVLLLISAMAAFACWLIGLACEAAGLDRWLSPFRSKRRLYSVLRLGREALARRWPIPPMDELIHQLRYPDARLLEQITMPASA